MKSLAHGAGLSVGLVVGELTRKQIFQRFAVGRLCLILFTVAARLRVNSEVDALPPCEIFQPLHLRGFLHLAARDGVHARV